MSSLKSALLEGNPSDKATPYLSCSFCREGLSDLPSSALLRRETLVPRQTARAMS